MWVNRDRLAEELFQDKWPFLRRWLEYFEGQDADGRRQPSTTMDLARCVEILHRLSQRQIDELCWRGIIPNCQGFIVHMSNQAVPLPCIGRELFVIHDPLFEQVFYDLLGINGLLRLRSGELERLEAAGYPDTIDGVLDVLWDRIAPVQFRQQPHSAAEALRDLAAVLHTGRADEATFEHLRELLPPHLADAEVRARAIDAERRVLTLAIRATEKDGADPELVEAVEEMITAWNPHA
ncbi:MAG TPA: hypothetical protein VFS21_07115 [Roseiflexaceae bacterium]|nr:hypothetical protein [Roseiflexaceae bacterium]